jgi:hypothetical protein
MVILRVPSLIGTLSLEFRGAEARVEALGETLPWWGRNVSLVAEVDWVATSSVRSVSSIGVGVEWLAGEGDCDGAVGWSRLLLLVL